MTPEETKAYIQSQPVGYAVLVLNDKCGSGYIDRIHRVAIACPEFVKKLAFSVLCEDYSMYAACDLIDHECYMLDKFGM